MKGVPFMLCDAALASRSDRERWASLVFETFHAPGFFVGRSGVLGLYASARTSGVAIDMGASGTVITPVQQGFPLMMGEREGGVWGDVAGVTIRLRLPHRAGVRTHALGGSAMDTLVLKQLPDLARPPASQLAPPRPGTSHHHPALVRWGALAAARRLKETVCTLAVSDADDAGDEVMADSTYTLPDGSKMSVPATVVHLPQLLWDATPVETEFVGITSLQETLAAAAMAVDGEIRPTLLEHMVLMGGASRVPGMRDALMSAFEAVVPLGCTPRLIAAEPEERALAPWIGGSILASFAPTIPDL